ncbi:MAG: hypothetical protein U9N36_07820 [Euryarchaeota archaeon]|nr:hypothetical protein [Euryarchaeota archaeon]
MKPILESCCGLDVHRDQVTACIASGPLDRAKEKLIMKEFSTMTYGLRELSSWLKEHDVGTVAMEKHWSFLETYLRASSKMISRFFWRMLPVSRMFQD